jgi:prepilin-type N-terminal cleavage/methylation domain-containing protein
MKKTKKNKTEKFKKAFTLIELMLVLILIKLLAN